eukprot:2040120-Alexandrium_andersonii.AAC.1
MARVRHLHLGRGAVGALGPGQCSDRPGGLRPRRAVQGRRARPGPPSPRGRHHSSAQRQLRPGH